MGKHIDQNNRYKKNYVTHEEGADQLVASGEGISNDYSEPDDAAYSEKGSDIRAQQGAEHASQDFSVLGNEEMTDAELLRRFIESSSEGILPAVPAIPGFHLCWVASNNQNKQDTVVTRQRIGYSLVKPEEVQGFTNESNRGAEMAGTVSFNELVLMKIPERIYQMYCKHMHHTMPNEQERAVKDKLLNMGIDKEGNSVVRDAAEMTGIAKLARKVAEPTFS